MSPQPINFGGVGDIDMLPAETHEAVSRIFQAGSIFGDRWKALSPAIYADEQIVNTGFDELSSAFRTQYNAIKPQLQQFSDQVQPKLEEVGTAGNDIVVRYLELTQQQVDRMRSLE